MVPLVALTVLGSKASHMLTEKQDAIRRALAEAGIDPQNFRGHSTGPAGPILRFDVDARQAIATWGMARTLVASTGHYPVVCHDEHGMLEELPGLGGDQPSKTIASASAIVASEWFSARESSDPDYYGSVEEGEWEEREPHTGWTVPFDLVSGQPRDGVWIALVPTTLPWQVAAYLDYGGWNECPHAAEHVAIHEHWHDRYGAELVCVSGGVLEMSVTRPPADRNEAAKLAREQFLYTGGDLVFQGCESMNALAASLLDAKYWYFWWD